MDYSGLRGDEHMETTNRKILGSSHGRQFEYWTVDGIHVYQTKHDANGRTQHVSWFCSMDAWERTFSRTNWILYT